MTNNITVKAPRKKKNASLDKRKARGGWLFVLPFVLGFVLIYLPMIVDSIRYSFGSLTPPPGGSRTFTYEFVGWANYSKALFEDPQFVSKLVEGLTDMVLDIPMILIFSLFMAVLLNQKMAGRAVFRAIFFIPVILSTGLMETAASTIEQNMSSTNGISNGAGQSAAGELVSTLDLQKMFEGMAIGDGLVNYVTQAINNIFDIVNRSGVQLLIFLAGLQSISPAIYESVQIDGASAWETFWKITFPMISPMILVNAVYTIIDSFTMNSNIVMTYIKTVRPLDHGEELASAMSWMYFLIVLAIIGLVAAIMSAYVFYQKKD